MICSLLHIEASFDGKIGSVIPLRETVSRTHYQKIRTENGREERQDGRGRKERNDGRGREERKVGRKKRQKKNMKSG